MTAKQSSSARTEYTSRLALRQKQVARLERHDLQIANTRLVVFLIAAGLAIANLTLHLVCAAWLVLPLLAFGGLVIWHARVLSQMRRARGAVLHYQRGLARLDGTWPGSGNTREDFFTEDHPYAADLDLFGHGSLFELLCNARTRAGEQTLARWLLAPGSVVDIKERHQAINELRERLDLREDLFLLGGEVREALHPDRLIAWGERRSPFSPAGGVAAHTIAWLLALLACGSMVAWAMTPLGPLPLAGVLILEWLVSRVLKRPTEEITAAIEQPERELAVLARVLARLEQEPSTTGRLRQLREQLTVDGVIASSCIRQLERRLAWLHAQKNQMFAPIAFVLMWHVHFGLAVEGWRIRHGSAIRRWLAAVGELEALSDLAGYAYEHPHDPFPELSDALAVFDGEALGHPLLQDEACVRNSVQLGDPVRVLIVSGSNMSGKTTLLRTVGINAVLALAGAPVRAARLRLGLLAIGATICIHDSIQMGRSRFYAELTRLQHLWKLATGDRPLLFLLDEILHGTNSHDRRVGAEALLQNFVKAGALGLVTTHDLALAEVVDRLGNQGANVHFADELDGGELRFDYTMRPGVVSRSNALTLMRRCGLPT